MTFHDLVTNSTGNLRRMKLRSALTIAGVVIAIATFVAMLSFGAGMQENLSDQFEEFGLLNTLQVYPHRNEDRTSDTTGTRAFLDQEAIRSFAAIPGVRLVYPFDDFNVTVKAGDSTVSTRAQSLPVAAVQTPLYSKVLAGTVFTEDSSDEIVISDDLLKSIGASDPDSLLGDSLIVSVRVTCLDSGIVNVVRDLPERLKQRLSGVWRDSLRYPQFWANVGREEGGAALSRFIDGYLNHRTVVSDTLRVGGVLEGRRNGRSKIEPVVLPAGTAARFRSSGFSDDPTAIMAALANGTLFATTGTSGKEYPQVTIDLDPNVSYEPIRDSIRALGFRTFSYADEFKEMRRFFFYFKLGLSAVGLIALITASLGIVNTMVMSIIERTREIGVLKSLGADERDIRILFLAESGMIGSIGAVFGIIVGWLITRLAYLVAYVILQEKDLPPLPFDPFSLPWWLILTAFAFGLVVSLLAGLYPAARASRVDPVEALRSN